VTSSGTSSAPRIAYFAMEVALERDIRTYSGGLGVLAGDTLRSAADLAVPVVAVTLLHRQGYFRQELDAEGRQHEVPHAWPVAERLEHLDATVHVKVGSREVRLGAWLYRVRGVGGHEVPVYLLDADLEQNHPVDRKLTDHLYGGDDRYRLGQEAVLGLGGMRLLHALGHDEILKYHINEGHSALLAVELLARVRDLDEVRRRCVFTTHTPVKAGHDAFPEELVRELLGAAAFDGLRRLHPAKGIDMTQLALSASGFVNGVAQRHGEVSRQMFPGHRIEAVTNGVHAATWAAPSMAALFDEHLDGWRGDSGALRNAQRIPASDLRRARGVAKRELVDEVNRRTDAGFDPEALTLGFARRATPYKRLTLLFSDPERLGAMASAERPLQIALAGKAHPRDGAGKALIEEVFRRRRSLPPHVRVAYLAGYDMGLGRLLTSGVDVWVNTPRPPREASGTSGMKAALNGVPNLSVLDGWWVEGHIEGVTGWAVGAPHDAAVPDDARDAADADDLHSKLEAVILPLYHEDPDGWADVMLHSIALNGSWFNTHRMVMEYVARAWLPR
jgi:starch phosphorylase